MGYRKLGRTSSQRKAMLRDLVSDLVINERIITTKTRAKEAQRLADKMVTLGKRGDLHARRQAAAFLRNELATVGETEEEIIVQSTLQKLFDDIAPRFEDRNGGYTRVLNTEPRRGDNAPMAVLEFVVKGDTDSIDEDDDVEEVVAEEE
ncbi:BL21 [Alloiococcus otitis]|uniref:Large ribosomal subunit protein bL17 n=1 Tax=Alloiococcus otitis ATCC 51267 TaxID=883081 RepID=K9EWG3_9LACT|nr:50S ribosomal protein L17 [Alloiococcus otitis]EKU93565.1 50S ribosomal protein L17 [Alloiococcus otitis ATCC 51267]SUU80341.1 BL21 [Alloiococcus otitis]